MFGVRADARVVRDFRLRCRSRLRDGRSVQTICRYDRTRRDRCSPGFGRPELGRCHRCRSRLRRWYARRFLVVGVRSFRLGGVPHRLRRWCRMPDRSIDFVREFEFVVGFVRRPVRRR
jgi:hypothetical protein